ncbi:hypothetical protein LSTR_LSTR013960 [Laodelphax striatellus]|uniref:Uncharacterized protein n=1 Tax=Laodelphax striatellus TaxID=195883 RepID=A0A482WPJ8_LAOST|nr:hypothetical protein LSTR_LSTR013960 [Laodelphax striatellus]
MDAPFHGRLKQERSGPVPNGRRLLFVFKIKFSINRNPSVGPSKQNRIDRWPEGKPAQWLCKSNVTQFPMTQSRVAVTTAAPASQ